MTERWASTRKGKRYDKEAGRWRWTATGRYAPAPAKSKPLKRAKTPAKSKPLKRAKTPAKPRKARKPPAGDIASLTVAIFHRHALLAHRVLIEEVMPELQSAIEGKRVDAPDGWRSRIDFPAPMTNVELLERIDDAFLERVDLYGASMLLGAYLIDGTFLPLSRASAFATDATVQAILSLQKNIAQYRPSESAKRGPVDRDANPFRNPNANGRTTKKKNQGRRRLGY